MNNFLISTSVHCHACSSTINKIAYFVELWLWGESILAPSILGNFLCYDFLSVPNNDISNQIISDTTKRNQAYFMVDTGIVINSQLKLWCYNVISLNKVCIISTLHSTDIKRLIFIVFFVLVYWFGLLQTWIRIIDNISFDTLYKDTSCFVGKILL